MQEDVQNVWSDLERVLKNAFREMYVTVCGRKYWGDDDGTNYN